MADAPIKVSETIVLDPKDIEFSYVRASGPGGQNVNKVSSAVQLRFDVAAASTLSDAMKSRVLALAGKRATQSGVIVIEAKRFRYQARNKAAAVERLIALIQAALKPAKPRRETRPTTASVQRRLVNKKKRGERKSLRRKPGRDGED